MTSSRYFLAQIGQAFGYFRKSQRMGDAASEMHLLREAEAALGASIWEKVEDIEELSVEYWNLRKLIKERDAVRARLAECQERLDLAHDERSELLNNTPEENQELLDERISILTHLENLAKQRDDIILQAREVRRTYVGLKMKLEVITKENEANPDPEAIRKITTQLLKLKGRFSSLKQERVRIGKQIEAGDHELDRVDGQLETKRKERRHLASDAFQIIGEGNKEISTLRAESGLIDTRMRQLYGEIGRYVSRYSNTNPACAAAAATHQGLVDVMRALRRSIALNHRLAGTA